MTIFDFTTKKTLFIAILLVILAGGLLTGCGTAEMDVTVYDGDLFDLKMVINMPSEMIQMIGGPYEVENLLDQSVEDALDEGLKTTWRRLDSSDKNTYSYEISIPKTEIHADFSEFFTWNEVDFNKRKAYEIKFVGIGDLSSELMSLTLNLHAGKILESNGREVNSSTVTWVNPSQIPTAIVTPKSSINWIPLVLSVLLIIALGAVVLSLTLSGRLKQWSTAGISAGKWKIQTAKLDGERKRVEQEKASIMAELGNKAWAARVFHPNYADSYSELESLDQEVNGINESIQALEQELQQSRDQRTKVASEYARQINSLQSEQKETKTRLNESQSHQKGLEKQFSTHQVEQSKNQSEIQTLQEKLAEVQASDLPDKEDRVISLTNAIGALEQSLNDSSRKIPEIQSEIERIQSEQQPLLDKITKLDHQISEVLSDQKATLAPIDQEIVRLEEGVKGKKNDLNVLNQKMAPMIRNLGFLVDSARPESEALKEIYDRLDKRYLRLASISQEQELAKAHLGASDTSAIRNFYITIAGIFIALLLIIVLLVISFS
jgi:predicted  nucleic acid-binding Zn-ribbon protein